MSCMEHSGVRAQAGIVVLKALKASFLWLSLSAHIPRSQLVPSQGWLNPIETEIFVTLMDIGEIKRRRH